MSYKKAAHVLLQELLAKVQEYVDGEFLYIPRASDNKKSWGGNHGHPAGTAGQKCAYLCRIPCGGVHGISGRQVFFVSEKYSANCRAVEKRA